MPDNHIKFPTPEDGSTPEIQRAEDVFPDLGNEKLIEAMEAINKEENRETQTKLIEQALQARFFAPVDVIDENGNLLRGMGKMPIPKNGKFNFKLIQNAKGEQYFPIFTDIENFKSWSGDGQVNAIVVIVPQMAQLSQQRPDAVNGFVINPTTQNIVFTQDAIKHLLDAMKAVAEQNAQAQAQAQQSGEKTVQIMFGKPKNVPDSVLKSITKKLTKMPQVNSAYFCMMKREEQEHYLFVLDIDAEPAEAKKLAESVCDSAKMFLTKFPVIAMPLNSPFGEGAKKVDGPFYTKK